MNAQPGRIRYHYAWGYKSAEAAFFAIEAMFDQGEVSQHERPEIESYTIKGKRLFAVTLEHDI